MHRWPTPKRSRPCRTHRSRQHVSVSPGDAGLLAILGQAFALGQLHLDLAQRHHNLLGADLSTSRHPGLLWFELILSISLGRVDGFDDDEAEGESHEGSEVLVGFLATERD